MIAFANMALAGLDFVAVAAIGVVGALAIRGLQSKGVGDRSTQILDLLGINEYSISSQILVLGLGAFLLLISKTILTYVLTRRVFIFTSRQSSRLSSELLMRSLSNPIDKVQKVSSQEYLFHLNNGTGHLMLGVVGNMIALTSDVALFMFLIALLMVADVQTAILSTALFLAIGLILFRAMKGKAEVLAERVRGLSIDINEKVVETFLSFREIRTRNTSKSYQDNINQGRIGLVGFLADQRMMPIFSKYVIEISVFSMFLAVAYIQFALNDVERAIANLTLFLAASSRISPAVLRIQQGLIQIKSSIAGGKGTLSLINSAISTPESRKVFPESPPKTLTPTVMFKNVSFKYKEDGKWGIKNINLEIPENSFVAMVGPSGGGKSSIVDLMFGLLTPSDGEVQIGGIEPGIAISLFPGSFGYVPQVVAVHKGTLFSNLLLGLEPSRENFKLATEVLDLVGLGDFLYSLDAGLNTYLLDRGSNLSGGQRQRLGIARALMTRPKLLVLDEATSSLDAKSEKIITESITSLKGKLTIVVVAHRLSTVRSADTLFYIRNGEIVASGSFDRLRRKLPIFDSDARIMGL